MPSKQITFFLLFILYLSYPAFGATPILKLTFQVPSMITNTGEFKIKGIARLDAPQEISQIFSAGIDLYKFQFKKSSGEIFYEKVLCLPPQKPDPSEMTIFIPDPNSDFEIVILRNVPITKVFFELQRIPIPLSFLNLPLVPISFMKLPLISKAELPNPMFFGTHARFTLMLLSDGYTEEMEQTFLEDSQRFVNGFLSHPLMAPFKNQFSIYRKGTWSPSSHIPSDYEEEKNQTRFYTEKVFGDSFILSYNQSEILSEAGPEIDYIFVIANTELPAGIASTGNYIVIGKNASSHVFVHEFLHLSLRLVDEYKSQNDIWNLAYRRWSANVNCIGKDHECIMNKPDQCQTLCPPCQEAYTSFFER